MTVRLREMGPADIEPVAAVEARCNPHPWPASLFRGELQLPAGSRHWLVAEEAPGSAAPTVVGFGGIMVAAGTAHLMNLGVDPPQRGRGIARRLCARLFLAARERGADEVTLEVRAHNAPAIALYTQLGLADSGCRPGYYPDGEDARIFWLHHLADDALTRHLKDLAHP